MYLITSINTVSCNFAVCAKRAIILLVSMCTNNGCPCHVAGIVTAREACANCVGNGTSRCVAFVGASMLFFLDDQRKDLIHVGNRIHK